MWLAVLNQSTKLPVLLDEFSKQKFVETQRLFAFETHDKGQYWFNWNQQI
jgi:hypothetical protein